jgi:dolichol-phosphate mannosyltransferase
VSPYLSNAQMILDLEGVLVQNKPLISIVTPCFNEEENVIQHYTKVCEVTKSYRDKYEFEHIYTDNNSQDKTFEILTLLGAKNPQIKAIRFSRNIGANRAIFFGLQQAKGDAVILIQADLQDPPEVIPQFIDGWEEGYDVVFGRILKRSESGWLQGLRKLYYRVVTKLSDVPIPKDAGEFRLTSRRALTALLEYTEDDLYIRGAIAMVGFKQKPIPYNRLPRLRGSSNINFLGLVSYGLNGLLSTTVVPIRAVVFLGFFLSALGATLVVFFILAKLFHPEIAPRGVTALGCLITFFAGAQLFALGIIGEYVRKTYIQSLGRPRGFIKDKVNLL